MNFKFDKLSKVYLEKISIAFHWSRIVMFPWQPYFHRHAFLSYLNFLRNFLDVLSLLRRILTICNNILYAMHDGLNMASVQR